jgi:hypothetical protein
MRILVRPVSPVSLRVGPARSELNRNEPREPDWQNETRVTISTQK